MNSLWVDINPGLKLQITKNSLLWQKNRKRRRPLAFKVPSCARRGWRRPGPAPQWTRGRRPRTRSERSRTWGSRGAADLSRRSRTGSRRRWRWRGARWGSKRWPWFCIRWQLGWWAWYLLRCGTEVQIKVKVSAQLYMVCFFFY